MTTAIFKKIVAAVIVAFVILGIVIFGQPGHLVPFVLILIASVVLAAFLFLLPEGLLKQAVTERKFLIARVLCLVVALAALVKAGLMMQPPTTAEEGMVIGHQSSDAFEDAETFQTSDSVVEAATPALAVEVAFSAAVMEAYSEGQDLYDEGNFEEAYPLF